MTKTDGRYDRSTGDSHSSIALDPTLYYSRALVTLILRTSCSCEHNWEQGIEGCLENGRRPVTLKDSSLLQKDTWIYGARFKISTGGVIIIQLRRIEEKREPTCENSSEKENSTNKIYIVFNKNRTSLIRERQKMKPRIQYTLSDENFDDYPDPDECIMYVVVKRQFEFRNCSKIQRVQCINETNEKYVVKACFQENLDGFDCMPEMEEMKSTKAGKCLIPTLCLRNGVCEIILLGGILFVYVIFSFICIKCCTKYQVRRILKNKRSEDFSTNFVDDPKTQIYTYSYKREPEENWTVQEINYAFVDWGTSFKNTSV
ncbi:uncharacterized protein LOC134229859 [Saccostrea cucullata]|uniref:uncharacterized protein LOC134229859 n=1 Tax=Saccostrea cuccullata TaxID=36930 RepID=UPI002ED2D14D